MTDNIKILIERDELYSKIKQVARSINEACAKTCDIDTGTEICDAKAGAAKTRDASPRRAQETLNIVCVLKGAVMFFSELVKHLDMPVKYNFVKLSSYGTNRTTSGKVTVCDMHLPDFKDENVLIVEDIIDTGLTLDFLRDYIKKNTKAKDVKIATLLDKKCKRQVDLVPDFSCFEVDDKFIVGFGLDDAEKYRNLDYIGYIEK